MDARRLTSEALLPLAHRGWDVLTDVPPSSSRGRARVDHVLVGPAGIFCLSSTRSPRRLEIAAGGGAFRSGQPSEDAVVPGDRDLAAAWQHAGALSDLVLAGAGVRVRVAPVLVWWGPFADRGRAHRGVLVVQGNDLLPLLESQPSRPVPTPSAVLAALGGGPRAPRTASVAHRQSALAVPAARRPEAVAAVR